MYRRQRKKNWGRHKNQGQRKRCAKRVKSRFGTVYEKEISIVSQKGDIFAFLFRVIENLKEDENDPWARAPCTALTRGSNLLHDDSMAENKLLLLRRVKSSVLDGKRKEVSANNNKMGLYHTCAIFKRGEKKKEHWRRREKDPQKMSKYCNKLSYLFVYKKNERRVNFYKKRREQ